jgi:hypothetical protein
MGFVESARPETHAVAIKCGLRRGGTRIKLPLTLKDHALRHSHAASDDSFMASLERVMKGKMH